MFDNEQQYVQMKNFIVKPDFDQNTGTFYEGIIISTENF